MNLVQPEAPEQAQQLLDVRQVGIVAHCSPRHLQRMVDDGLMPAPIRLGSLVRWPRHVIDSWIAAGCPPVNPKANESASKEAANG